MNKRLEYILGKTQKPVATVTSLKFLIILTLLLALGTFAAWQYHVTTNKDRVFWGMVDTNLKTSSYSRHVAQSGRGQTVDQIVEVTTKPHQVAFSDTILEQTGRDNAAKVVTENIGTPNDDYVRYTDIVAQQKSVSGGALDFSQVVNVWGKAQQEDGDKTSGQLYSQSVLGVIPTGNLTATQRAEVIKIMKEQGSYEYKLRDTKRTGLLQRPTYVFDVTVKPIAYIAALKQFAAYSGLNQLEEINPDDYASAQPVQFSMSVDGWTHQLISFTQVAGGRTEATGSRNIKKLTPQEPTKTISVDELQTRLESVQ